MRTTLVLAFQDPAVVPVVPVTGYTAGEVLLFFGALGVLLPILASAIVSIIVALRMNAKVDAVATATQGLAAQVKAVEHTTNSGLSGVKSELKESNALNKELRDTIADLKSERGKADVAKALATPVPTVRAQDGRAGDAASEQLKAIEKNTAETVEVLKDQNQP